MEHDTNTTVPHAGFSSEETDFIVGGQPAVVLRAPSSPDENTPRIISAHILPGRGMNTYQLRAYLPGRGEFDMLFAPPIGEAPSLFDKGPVDFMGNRSFMVGGAILVPFGGRIRGTLCADGKSLETSVLGKTVILPANWSSAGNTRGEKVTMHGLMLQSHMDEVVLSVDDTSAAVTGILKAGDFDGRWIGWSRVATTCTLSEDGFSLRVEITNDGDEDVPMSVSWHPYYMFPSGERGQVRLHVPARSVATVNNYDDVFPTGDIVTVEGTPYDLRDRSGSPLGDSFFDDSFTDLSINDDGNAILEMTDPAAAYGLRIRAGEPVKAVQVYAPTDQAFVAIEPQFNLTDPFNEETWGSGANRGMEILQPGESTTYRVSLELFVP